MANKKSQKNTIIGSIITVIILIILTITGNDSQIFKSTTQQQMIMCHQKS